MVEIVDFLNNVTTKNFVEAEKQFSELINDRLATRIDDEKTAVAAQVFNNAEEQEEAPEVEADEVEEPIETSEEETEDENL